MFTKDPSKKVIAITGERFVINDVTVMEKPMALSDSSHSSLLLRLLKYVLLDILKNKMILFYTVFLFAVSFGILSMSGDAVKGIASLLNILLLVTPLLSIIFSTIYFYNSYEFIEVLASQPIRRRTILLSHYCGLCLSLLISLLVGAGIPLLMYAPELLSLTLLMTTGALTMVFVSLAMVAALFTRDKAKGIGLSILLWFYFSILYDALMLMIMFAFIDYPLEKATLAMIALNPVDLARTVVLLQMDISALMGYTGALMQDIMGNHTGVLAAGGIMMLWIILPLLLAVRKFNCRDF